jgi:hypothetical protein
MKQRLHKSALVVVEVRRFVVSLIRENERLEAVVMEAGTLRALGCEDGGIVAQ